MKKIIILTVGLIVLLSVLSLLIVLMQSDGIPTGDRVALVRVEGAIIDAKNAVEDIKGYAKDTSVKAIVLRVDSPGGAVAPSQEIYDEVRKAVARKKVVVSMGSVAASGGYYISAPATRIVANPGTLTGSIGVIMEIPNIEGLMSKVGIRTEVIKSGKHKDMASVFRGIGKEERVILQGVLDDVHEQFITAVAEGRKIAPAEVRKIADGRVFTGKQALAARLVDELGNLEDAIQVAAKLAGIKGDPHVISKKERFSLIDLIRGGVPKELAGAFPSLGLKFLLVP